MTHDTASRGLYIWTVLPPSHFALLAPSSLCIFQAFPPRGTHHRRIFDDIQPIFLPNLPCLPPLFLLQRLLFYNITLPSVPNLPLFECYSGQKDCSFFTFQLLLLACAPLFPRSRRGFSSLSRQEISPSSVLPSPFILSPLVLFPEKSLLFPLFFFYE